MITHDSGGGAASELLCVYNTNTGERGEMEENTKKDDAKKGGGEP